jgi:hypothetical protein
VDIFLSATPTDTYCWLQLDQGNLDQRTRQTFGIEQLTAQDRIDRCPTCKQTIVIQKPFVSHFLAAEPTTTTCFEAVWTTKRNYHSTPALNFGKITTQAECMSQCVATQYCVGIDVDTNPGATLCWMYNSLSYFDGNGAFKAGVLHMKLDERCPSRESIA